MSIRLTGAEGLVCLLGMLSWVQISAGQEVPNLRLRVTEEKSAAWLPRAPTLRPIKCDARGNLYLRNYLPPRPLAAPVVKISPEGEAKGTFSLEAVGGFTESTISDFAVGPGGEVYILAIGAKEHQEPEVDVFAFAEDGSYRWNVKLEEFFSADHLAFFPSGEFLVAGTRRGKAAPVPPGAGPEAAREKTPPVLEPYTAVFDRGGRVVRKLTLPGDVQLGDASLSAEQKFAVQAAISVGTAVTGDDGNVYLMRRTEKALVFVLSADGTVVRRFELEPPSAKMRATKMQFAGGGMLIVEFATEITPRRFTPRGAVFSLVQGETGQRVLDYQFDPSECGELCLLLGRHFYVPREHEGGRCRPSTRRGPVGSTAEIHPRMLDSPPQSLSPPR